jgi:hypothetical protein
MKTNYALCVLILLLVPSNAPADTFGSGSNVFDIAFVNIGNPGNAADMTGSPNPAGALPFSSFRMGQFEISEQMIDKANTEGGLDITKDTRGVDKPATSISWNEAARFVNWLNTSTGGPPAYKFALQPGEVGYNVNANIELWTNSDAGYNPRNLYRNSLARYFLPSVHEWYKAAYYDPTSGVYYDYPTGSNTPPTPVASGTAAGTAVYLQQGPANITLAGGLSPYGTMGQGGNAQEWEETDVDLVNDSNSSARGNRGGNYSAFSGPGDFSSTRRVSSDPASAQGFRGFRVASIPEPSTFLPGDFNFDSSVDAADYVVWRKTNGTAEEYGTWRANFGATVGGGSVATSTSGTVPEPSISAIVLFGALITSARFRHRRNIAD